MSLLCRLKNLVHKGILKEKDLERIVIIPKDQEPCEDCISRQAVLDMVEDMTDQFGTNHRVVTEGMISMLPPVTPKQKTEWIPVSERLPEDFQRVLVTIVNYKGDKVVRVAEYYGWKGKGVFQIKENHEQWEVGEKGLLAWMPLPESYKSESEDKE